MKDLLAQYAWAGPIIVTVIGFLGGVIGFLVGLYWKRAELRLQDRTVTLQQLAAERELYERLQHLQQQVADAIPKIHRAPGQALFGLTGCSHERTTRERS